MCDACNYFSCVENVHNTHLKGVQSEIETNNSVPPLQVESVQRQVRHPVFVCVTVALEHPEDSSRAFLLLGRLVLFPGTGAPTLRSKPQLPLRGSARSTPRPHARVGIWHADQWGSHPHWWGPIEWSNCASLDSARDNGGYRCK